jgi:predicted RNase H-like HicB family nuclease
MVVAPGLYPWDVMFEEAGVPVVLKIELERESDGRWIAEVIEMPGVLAYGATRSEAIAYVEALALRVVADRLENGETAHDFLNITFAAA